MLLRQFRKRYNDVISTIQKTSKKCSKQFKCVSRKEETLIKTIGITGDNPIRDFYIKNEYNVLKFLDGLMELIRRTYCIIF